jgi:chromosome segregation ATPase
MLRSGKDFGFHSPKSDENDSQSRDTLNNYKAKIEAVSERAIETRCAIEGIEERNAQLASQNAELELLVTQLQNQISEKAAQFEQLKAGFDGRQSGRNAYWAAQVAEIEQKICRAKSKRLKH